MKLEYDIGHGQTTLTFSGKPSADVRSAMKANRYRWSPSGGYWWKRGSTDAADLIGAIQTMLDREAGIRRPDGPCWKCKDREGFLRNRGAAAPVLCDSCNQADIDHQNRPDAFDLRYEDDCARQCGL
jgi:hypothetical protein